VLNPHDEPGRLTLHPSHGRGEDRNRVAAAAGRGQARMARVLWVCDAMHGNTESTANGFKTRRFDNMRSEVEMRSICMPPQARVWAVCTWN
jgi:3-deoxy-7-phosphoheptulonate synthase